MGTAVTSVLLDDVDGASVAAYTTDCSRLCLAHKGDLVLLDNGGTWKFVGRWTGHASKTTQVTRLSLFTQGAVYVP
jgi:hypothetical protein